MTDQLSHPDDLSAISATDAVLDALICGDGADTRDSDAAADLLGEWRAELDAAAAMPSSANAPYELGSRPRRWARTHRHAAAAAAAALVLAASTGVAAAASGPSGPLGPLHRVLFGSEPAHRIDLTAIRAEQLLGSVQARLDRLAGGATRGQRTSLRADLDRAAALLAGDDRAPADLRAQLGRLRDRLAGLPDIPAAPIATSPKQGAAGSGPDRTGGPRGDGSATGDHGSSGNSGDGSGSSGDDGSEVGTGSGSRDGSVSGSDDGGSGDAGSDGGGRDSGTTRSGSGDGSADTTGTRDGGGSDGSTDGGGDGSQTSGDQTSGDQTSGDQSGSGGSDSRDSSDASSADGGN